MAGLVNDAWNLSSVSLLPWIPHTTSAVALRLMELDSAILYTPDQKAESVKEAETRQFIVSIEFSSLFLRRITFDCQAYRSSIVYSSPCMNLIMSTDDAIPSNFSLQCCTNVMPHKSLHFTSYNADLSIWFV